jgi:hypothetical protein
MANITGMTGTARIRVHGVYEWFVCTTYDLFRNGIRSVHGKTVIDLPDE